MGYNTFYGISQPTYSTKCHCGPERTGEYATRFPAEDMKVDYQTWSGYLSGEAKAIVVSEYEYGEEANG